MANKTDCQPLLVRQQCLLQEQARGLIDDLSQLRDQLAVRLEVYKNTTIANLEREVEILRKRVEVSQAQDLAAQVDLGARTQP